MNTTAYEVRKHETALRTGKDYRDLINEMEQLLPTIYAELNTVGIKLPLDDWKIQWMIEDRANNTLGLCQYHNKQSLASTVYINAFYFLGYDNSDKLKNTMIHELLHALFPYAGHMGDWKLWARRLNWYFKYDIKRCATGAETAHVVNEMEERVKYVHQCSVCGKLHKSYRMCSFVRHPENWRCGTCGSSGTFKEVK